MKNLKISHKIFLLVGSMLIVFTLFACWLYMDAKHNYIQARRNEIQHIVETSWGILDHYAKLADKGVLTRSDAQLKSIETVQNLRFAEKNYFWINDLHPRMIMHPFNPELIGKDLTNYKDPKGKALFVEMVALCRNQGKGFIEYVWHKPNSATPVGKVSFVKELPQWGWIIGAGVYTDDIDNALAKIFYTTFLLLSSLLAGGIILTLMVSRQISAPLDQAVQAMEKLGRGNFDVHMGMSRTDEIGRMANAIDACVHNLRELFKAIRSM